MTGTASDGSVRGRWGSKVTAGGLSRLSAIRGSVWCCGGRAPPPGGGSPGSLGAFGAL